VPRSAGSEPAFAPYSDELEGEEEEEGEDEVRGRQKE
jgi:hypothetical protein